ncbi:IclR family transcriptional regulator [Hydrogenophaga sp.]|uniref:IclR family transcriptional regulator n=1 Tax=Hydrogenophaga sp. TaxID=1904254 RepID=UPI002715A6CC|nr:IclR family transcriptional regulator [Hydrogenophaga sp.]MDO9436558.1 IclR family transcriptional regulator [Hydrogenophaga sp.]
MNRKPTAVAKSLAVLKAIAEPGPHRVSTLTRATGLNKATILRILDELEREGFVTRDAERAILFGAESFIFASAVERQPQLRAWAQPSLRRLADETGDNAILSIRSGLQIVCIERELGAYPVRASYLTEGRRLPLGIGSNGLAMLAALPASEAEEILDANTEAIARYGRIAPTQLRADLARARQQGYAVTSNIVSEGTGGISVALRGADGSAFGTLTVAAVVGRLASRETLLHGLLKRESLVVQALVAAH